MRMEITLKHAHMFQLLLAKSIARCSILIFSWHYFIMQEYATETKFRAFFLWNNATSEVVFEPSMNNCHYFELQWKFKAVKHLPLLQWHKIPYVKNL